MDWHEKKYQMPQNGKWRIRIHKRGWKGSILFQKVGVSDWYYEPGEIKLTGATCRIPSYVQRKVKSLCRLAMAWEEIPKVLL